MKTALANSPIMAFIATTQPEQARIFYGEKLGLLLQADTPFAFVVSAPNATLRIQKVQSFTPQPFTVLGWKVENIRASIEQLQTNGIVLERHDGMNQDDHGIWLSPAGARVCWFKDPDGNVLSLTQDA
jgi:catechol 2,3-dioxygenase-like lactoylglutathione lyase family enzyme